MPALSRNCIGDIDHRSQVALLHPCPSPFATTREDLDALLAFLNPFTSITSFACAMCAGVPRRFS
jgi:hypothetical protein